MRKLLNLINPELPEGKLINVEITDYHRIEDMIIEANAAFL